MRAGRLGREPRGGRGTRLDGELAHRSRPDGVGCGARDHRRAPGCRPAARGLPSRGGHRRAQARRRSYAQGDAGAPRVDLSAARGPAGAAEGPRGLDPRREARRARPGARARAEPARRAAAPTRASSSTGCGGRCPGTAPRPRPAGALPHIDGLPVLRVQVQATDQGKRPLMVVAQQLASGQVIQTIEGPAADVSAAAVPPWRYFHRRQARR